MHILSLMSKYTVEEIASSSTAVIISKQSNFKATVFKYSMKPMTTNGMYKPSPLHV